MPSRNEDLVSLREIGRGLDYRRTSSSHHRHHHQPSRLARETSLLSPRSHQSLKFKEKGSARIDNPTIIRPPNAGPPLEFLRDESSKDELVKYMSKLPGYLQRGDMTQDSSSLLNFGVLDWGRLEQWTTHNGSSLSSTSGSMGSSVDFSPVVKPMASSNTVKSAKKGKEIDRKQESHGNYGGNGVDSRSVKGKEKCLYQDTEVLQPKKHSEHSESRDLDSCNEQKPQDSIVLLLPKDFSRPRSSEMSRRASSLHSKSGQHNWGSFSDLFSIDEIHTDDDESFSDILPSCSADPIAETEKDLDLKLDSLIKAQGVECLDKPPDESSKHQRFGFGLARMTKSLSLKEGSSHPPLSSMYVTAKSGPAKPEDLSNVHAKARSSPFKRLLDPILKQKAVNQKKKHSNDLRMDPPISVVGVAPPEIEKCEAVTVKALLHLTVKSGLPLFKFVVETNNEILASTVKSLSSFGKDEISLMYTFYSVHKVRKKSSGWKNQKVKSCGFGYNVVGQMKVSKESVLCSVDVSKSDPPASEIVTGREIAAIVVDSSLKDEKSTQTVVILPGGDHSQPHEGVASSLINRWRTGGSCDCGGWDEGCKLRILADLEDRRGLFRFRSGLMDIRCDLYDQGETKKSSPFPLFRLVPFRDGLYSVEFDNRISSLQAFSICIAVINNKQPTLSSDSCRAPNRVELKHEFGAAKASFVSGEGHPHPPVSPVGRV